MYYAKYILFLAIVYWCPCDVLASVCPPPAQYCTIKEARVAVPCSDNVSSTTDAVLKNKALWTFVSKRNPFCMVTFPSRVNISGSIRSKIQSSLVKGGNFVIFACPMIGSTCRSLRVVRVFQLSDVLNVSLAYDGQQYYGETGTLTCIISWAANYTFFKKSWLESERETLFLTTIKENRYVLPAKEKYVEKIPSLSHKNAQEYQCGARVLVFGTIPVKRTDNLRIRILLRVTMMANNMRTVPETTVLPPESTVYGLSNASYSTMSTICVKRAVTISVGVRYWAFSYPWQMLAFSLLVPSSLYHCT